MLTYKMSQFNTSIGTLPLFADVWSLIPTLSSSSKCSALWSNVQLTATTTKELIRSSCLLILKRKVTTTAWSSPRRTTITSSIATLQLFDGTSTEGIWSMSSTSRSSETTIEAKRTRSIRRTFTSIVTSGIPSSAPITTTTSVTSTNSELSPIGSRTEVPSYAPISISISSTLKRSASSTGSQTRTIALTSIEI